MSLPDDLKLAIEREVHTDGAMPFNKPLKT